MLCRDIIREIERAYPKACAMEWDNVGLLTGSGEQEVRRIYVALDATDEIIDAAVEAGADLLVTHHPMIFSSIRSVTDDDFIGRRIIRLIREHISCYAMHTNYDVMGMGELAERTMGFRDGTILDVTCPADPADGMPRGIGRVIELERTAELHECCDRVKESFGLETVRVFGDPKRRVKRIAISPGSGKSMIRPALESGADVLITGDIDHHTGIDAAAQGLAIIDAGHYGIEKIFVRDMAEFLRAHFPETEVFTAPVSEPFWYA